MLCLRLARFGRKRALKFRLLVQEKARSPKSGKFKAIVGNYDPKQDKLEFQKEEIEKYLQQGAQLSDTLARLLTKKGVSGLEKFISKYTHKKPKKEATAKSPQPAKSAEQPKTKEKPEAKKEAAGDSAKAAETPTKKESTAQEPKKEAAGN